MMVVVMLIIGHRGAAGLAPENTLESIRAGIAAGADIIEIDVRLTRDGIPILLHDTTTKRTHTKRLSPSKHTLAELTAQLGVGTIVTLKQVLDEFFGKILLNIELKGKGTGAVVSELILYRYCKKPSHWDNVILSSFRGRELIAARATSERVNLALIHDQNPFIFIAYQRKLQLTAVGFHRLYINPFAMEIARRLNLFTYAYTVDRPQTALQLKRQHAIDAVVTNRPDKIIARLEREAH